MIVTLKIQLGTYWSACIELQEESTLEEVHNAIQQAVDFDNDHLYAFYVAGTVRARKRILYDDENGRLYDTMISDMFPVPPKKQLFYLFDYGDEWIFKISKLRKSPHPPVDGIEYPRVVHENGKKPIQYEVDDYV